MNIFFGKISDGKEPEQLRDGYYRAVKDSSWFNGIVPNDYAFIIGGGKIQLWQATEWNKKNGDDILSFRIIHNDLGINTKQFTAFKYFNLTMELVVLSVRSTGRSKIAFFKIDYFSEFSEQMLLNKSTYSDSKNYRNITIIADKAAVDPKSSDLQLFKADKEWQLYNADFISANILADFHDNTHMLGNGRPKKDSTIKKIIDPENIGKKLTPDYLSVLEIYDLFCCRYNSDNPEIYTENTQDNTAGEIDINEYNSGNIIIYGPPGTGKTYEVLNIIEELDRMEMLDKQQSDKTSTVLDLEKTFWHLAPGRNGHLWDKLKNNNYLGYEWCNKKFGDLSALPKSTDNYQIRKRFSMVKKGDYFCIIRGRKCLGIAEAQYDYDPSKVDQGPFNFQTIEVKWLPTFDAPILLSTSSTMTFSGIGGRRWDELLAGLKENGFSFSQNDTESSSVKKMYKFTTFHQSYSYEDFVEGIKPKLLDERVDEDTAADIEYEIAPGVFYTACDKAAQLAGYDDLQAAIKDKKDKRRNAFSKASPYYLLIDEINRGNVANIFGELITLIEKDKRLGADMETMVTLPYSKMEFGVPSNLVLIGTMNTADRSIEALDSALRRRFTFLEKAPDPKLLESKMYQNENIDLCKLLETINARIELLLDKDHLIGHSYFMGIKTLSDIQSVFKNKIIPLLEEYFYGRPQMIGMILGEDFLIEKDTVPFFYKFDYDNMEVTEKKCYNIVIPNEWKSYRAIYESN